MPTRGNTGHWRRHSGDNADVTIVQPVHLPVSDLRSAFYVILTNLLVSPNGQREASLFGNVNRRSQPVAFIVAITPIRQRGKIGRCHPRANNCYPSVRGNHLRDWSRSCGKSRKLIPNNESATRKRNRCFTRRQHRVPATEVLTDGCIVLRW